MVHLRPQRLNSAHIACLVLCPISSAQRVPTVMICSCWPRGPAANTMRVPMTQQRGSWCPDSHVPLAAAYAHELVGNHMPLTHESLSQMIGVRRTSVTEVAGNMQRAGMISYTRGRLHIVDIELVRTNANSRISASRCRECSASKWPRHHRAGSPPRQR